MQVQPSSVQTPAQPPPQRPVALEIPFAAERVGPGLVSLRVQKPPPPPARRLGAGPGVVLGKALIEIGGPADIGARVFPADLTQHVDVAISHCIGCHNSRIRKQ